MKLYEELRHKSREELNKEVKKESYFLLKVIFAIVLATIITYQLMTIASNVDLLAKSSNVNLISNTSVLYYYAMGLIFCSIVYLTLKLLKIIEKHFK